MYLITVITNLITVVNYNFYTKIVFFVYCATKNEYFVKKCLIC
ncbi:hypothetical protein B0I03_1087 [Flavobacterium aquaticum]|uniref:Uncharacterized protein n=1 Tax=Flavobacterium aquaticum TaxID=1236486 RepID=A0A327YGB3_9FLAO|nr:hypothetical protein B0I03_1087 [Flavobacterium aquaticum]